MAEVFSPCRKAKLNFGFTLAETLITLGIIGVVAALTIPALVQKYQEKVWTTSFLRVYSLLENAYKASQEEYGTFDQWNYITGSIQNPNGSSSEVLDYRPVLDNMIIPHMKIVKILESPKNHNYLCGGSIKMLDGTSSWASFVKGGQFILSSGECIMLASELGDFYVDLNSKKGPNVVGKDIFIFSFDRKKPERIRPGYPYYWGWNTDTASYCDKTDKHGWISGISCGYWILRHRNMDYLHLPYEEIEKDWN